MVYTEGQPPPTVLPVAMVVVYIMCNQPHAASGSTVNPLMHIGVLGGVFESSYSARYPTNLATKCTPDRTLLYASLVEELKGLEYFGLQ